MELWRGLHQSTVEGRASLYVNADVLNKAVPTEMSVLDFVKVINRGTLPPTLNQWQLTKVQDHLKQLKIAYIVGSKVPVRIKQFHRLGSSAALQKFPIDGKMVTVQSYFETKMNVILKYPGLPTIQVLPANKTIYLPMEFCKIQFGQLTQKKYEPSREMITKTAVSTDIRKTTIQTFLQTYAVNEDMKKFGIEIDKKFAQVISRILNQPQINYRESVKKPMPLNGTWKDGKFIAVSPVTYKYAIVNCESLSIQVLLDLKREINAAAHNKGILLEDSQGNENILTVNIANLEKNLKRELGKCREKGFGFVFVILNDKTNSYDMAKTIAETEVGIITQCLKLRSFFDNRQQVCLINSSTMDNIFLKINSKLNGTNHQVFDGLHTALTKQYNVMFIGADVTHPTPDQKATHPSVAAVCTSYDSTGYLYHPVWRLQKGGKDGIEDFEEIMVEQLEYYKHNNENRLPSALIYYRDGVGESQFETFLEPEIAAMTRACQRLYPQGMIPRISLIVVNKRHHMRAFPTCKDGDRSKFNNILPGTVVDKDIGLWWFFRIKMKIKFFFYL